MYEAPHALPEHVRIITSPSPDLKTATSPLTSKIMLFFHKAPAHKDIDFVDHGNSIAHTLRRTTGPISGAPPAASAKGLELAYIFAVLTVNKLQTARMPLSRACEGLYKS